jgi:hypothetical protein
MRLFRVVALILLCAVTFVAVFAQDAPLNPLDPKTNPDANACFEGGTLEGKCDSQILWEAGWYLIRFEKELISREDFLPYYAWILPQLQEETIVAPAAISICYTFDDFGDMRSFTLITGVKDGMKYYNNTTCSGSVLRTRTVVVATSQKNADTACTNIFGFLSGGMNNWFESATSTPSIPSIENTYSCGVG